MKTYNKEITSIEEPIVVAIGFFDGVHQGHQYLLNQVKEVAKARSLASAVITFIEHPRRILDEAYQPTLLNSYDERLKHIEDTGIDYCIPLHFTKELSQLTAEEFMKTVLKDQFNVEVLVIGYDHRFGCGRVDGFAEYVEYGRKIGIAVIQAHELDTGVYVSSSHIRDLLKEGLVEEATKLLTYNYTIEGTVIDGNKIGRTIGYPTANIAISEPNKITPEEGVYVSYIYLRGKKYKGMFYIGKRPTLHNADNLAIEVYIFDFDEDIYGEKIAVEILHFVRRDAKFVSLEVLKRQLGYDEERVRLYFAELEQ